MDATATPARLPPLLGPTTAIRRVVLLLLLLINGAVAWNAVRHDTRIGYDSRHHLRYVEVLAEGRLPGPKETRQSYAPPLPYVLPAALVALTGIDAESATRAALLLQAVLSVGLCLGLLALCRRLRPGNGWLCVAALLLLGMPAAYYRTFAMLRGEPYLTFLTVGLTLLVFEVLDRKRFSLSLALGLGTVWALLALARQWGLVVIGASAGFLVLTALWHRDRASPLAGTAALGLALCLLGGGWFYAPTSQKPKPAFNQKLCLDCAPSQMLGSATLGLGWPRIIQQPGRPAFSREPLAILYSDWWGDHFHYFLVHATRDPGHYCLVGGTLEDHLRQGIPRGTTSNRPEMSAYLGRTNLLAFLPTALLFTGLCFGTGCLARAAVGRDRNFHDLGMGLLAALVLATLAGHSLFVLMVGLGGPSRDVMKATYDLQLLPPLALLGADVVCRLRRRTPASAWVVLFALMAVAIHGYGTAFSRWTTPQPCALYQWDVVEGASMDARQSPP